MTSQDRDSDNRALLTELREIAEQIAERRGFTREARPGCFRYLFNPINLFKKIKKFESDHN